MKRLALEHAILTLAAALGLGMFHSIAAAIAFMVGSTLALINFTVLFLHLGRVFGKKQVALGTSVIIFKYLILGLIIYFIVARSELQLFWFAVGLISLLFALAIRAVFLKQNAGTGG